MSQKSLIIAAVVIVVLGTAFYFIGNKNMAPVSTAPAAGQGKVIIGISDAATEIQGVSSIMVTVDKVEVQSAAQGWVTVSGGSKQYDLLQLKQSGAVALLADANLSTGTYDQIRLTISKVQVSGSGTATQEAKLPSGTLRIVGRVVVEEGKTATAVLDFKADKSLHATGNGKFILAPVVNLQTKSDASVEQRSDATLSINGGKSEDNVNVGMDEHGDVKDNFELDANAKIEIDADDTIHVLGQGESDDQGKGEDNNSGSITLNLSSQNNSGIAGTATLQETDGKVTVKLRLTGAPAGALGIAGLTLGASHPAHIHTGSCASIGDVKYPLNSTVNGSSDTTLNVSLADLKAQLPLAINVHKSSNEIGTYIACADIHL